MSTNIDQPQLERLGLASTILRYIGVFSGLLYFCGFAYLKYLFRQFNVDIWDLKLGWIDVIPYSWSVVEQFPKIIFSNLVYFVVIVVLIPLLLVLGERLANSFLGSATLLRYGGRFGIMNSRFYLPALALLALFYVLVVLTHEAALHRRDMVVKWQRTAVELRFRTEDGKQKLDDLTKGRNLYFFPPRRTGFTYSAVDRKTASMGNMTLCIFRAIAF